jgi:hypothetical protein
VSEPNGKDIIIRPDNLFLSVSYLTPFDQPRELSTEQTLNNSFGQALKGENHDLARKKEDRIHPSVQAERAPPQIPQM